MLTNMLVALAEIDRAVRASWAADTCSPDDAERRPWTSDNPAWGHCDVTAAVVNDLLGGDLMVGEVHLDEEQHGYHMWNLLASGLEIDLTREQFQHGQTVTEGRLVKRPEGPPRYRNSEYMTFRQRVIDRLGWSPASPTVERDTPPVGAEGLEPMEVTFRRACRDDVVDIVRLLRDDQLGREREQGEGPVESAYWRAFDEIERDERQLLVVADHEGEVVGTLQLSFIPYLTYAGGERAQIEAIRVDDSLRGRGIGRAMIEWAIEQARGRGCHMVQLTTNKARLEVRRGRFYEKLGFEPTHVGMKLQLTR